MSTLLTLQRGNFANGGVEVARRKEHTAPLLERVCGAVMEMGHQGKVPGAVLLQCGFHTQKVTCLSSDSESGQWGWKRPLTSSPSAAGLSCFLIYPLAMYLWGLEHSRWSINIY